MNFSFFIEKPVEPKKIRAHQFKRGEENGLCFNTGIWSLTNWIYSGDHSPEEFERLRKMHRIAKNKLRPYINYNNQKLRIKHNHWIVIHSDFKVEVLSPDKFKDMYVQHNKY
ncbi:hypothetical protein [Bacillus subtilis]|uniref:hypothetical protein n=1 Tax=Bacillus subtilis TaxID=1423 RepID=UPI0021DA04B6|nr:hypothetical protein [Bacillus subtilis]